MNKLLAFLLTLFVSVSANAVRLSELSGAYSLADSAYGLALNGTTDDGAAAIAAFATIGTGKTVVLPAGKTLLTCRQITLPAGTTLIAYGAKIKRCNQPTATTTTDPITNGATPDIATTAYASFKVGEQIAFSNGTQYSYVVTIYSCGATVSGATCTASPLKTTASPVSTFTLSTGAAAASITGGTITIYRAFSTLATGGDRITVKGLEFDGNAANTAALCRWEWCTEMKVLNSYFTLQESYFHDSPGEAIQESSYVSSNSTTSITRSTTVALVVADEAKFAVGDMVFAARDSQFQWADGARIVTAIDTGTHTVTVNDDFGSAMTGAGTTTLYKMLDTPTYQNNKFERIAGNAVHFSASSRPLFTGNYIKNGNTDFENNGNSSTNVGHQYGCVTFSSYVSEAIIEQNYIENCYNGIGTTGANNDGIVIANNQIRSAAQYAITMTATGITNDAQVCGYSATYSCGGLHRVIITGNKIFGDWSYVSSHVTGGLYIRTTNNSNNAVFDSTTIGRLASDYGVKDVVISGNEFYKTEFYISGGQNIIFSNNIFDAWPTSNFWPLGNIQYSRDIHLIGNTFIGGTYAIDITQGANNGTVLRGNVFSRQNTKGLKLQGTALRQITVDANTFIAPNSGITDSSYKAIDGVPLGSFITDNKFIVDKGTSCISGLSTTANYTATTVASVVSGNSCVKPTGTRTSSISVPGTSTGLIVTENYVGGAISDSGISTVTTPANITLP